jgi:hypothetical protein
MSDHTDHAEVTREYAAAHAAHYSDRDLVTALPAQKLLDARMELALVCLEDQISPVD